MEGLIAIKVIGCQLTRDTELFGKMDPYCFLQVGDQKAMTSVKIDAGKKCDWNETFTFYVKEGDLLKFQVYDEDPGADDLVGEGSLTVSSSYTEKQSFAFALSYNNKGAGEIQLEIQFFPQETKKIEEVKKIQNLIREKQILLEKYQKEEYKDVEIINSSDDNKKEEELKKAIELDKAEIIKLDNEFKELFTNFDSELRAMNGKLSTLMKENAQMKEALGATQMKINEFKKPIVGGVIEILCQKATIVRDVESLGTMDPFVVFYLGKNKNQTIVAKDQGKHPVWNQNLKLSRTDEDILRFDIIDYNDVLKSKIIGYGSISLFNIVRTPEKKLLSTIVFYKGEKVGTLDLEIHFSN